MNDDDLRGMHEELASGYAALAAIHRAAANQLPSDHSLAAAHRRCAEMIDAMRDGLDSNFTACGEAPK